MKQLFKTTLLAATIAATCGAAVAGTVTVDKQTHSLEGLKGVTADQTSNAISYQLGAGYLVGDKIIFSFPANTLVAASFPSTIPVPAVNSDDPTMALVGMSLGLIDSTDNTATYRVTSLSQPSNVTAPVVAYTDKSTLGNTVVLGAFKYKAAALETAPVTVTVNSVEANGSSFDTPGTRTATVAQAATQFGSGSIEMVGGAPKWFKGVIDVSSARKAFVGSQTDSLGYVIVNPEVLGADKLPGGTGANADWMNLATVNTTSAIVYGEAGQMNNITDKMFATGGTNTFAADAAQLSVAYSGQVTNDTISFTAPGTIVLESQKFTTDLVYNYTSAGAMTGSKVLATGLASGSWTLNGATVNIPYMPYSANASQIMYVSNAGTQEGDILVTAFDDKGTMYDLGKVGVAAGMKVTKITKFIGDQLAAKGFTGGKLSLTVTVNAPSADVTVYASYNIGGADRGFVNTDQYKGK